MNNTHNAMPTKPSFKGHMHFEKIVHNGQKLFLRKETALFRDMETRNFVKDYILQHFSNKPHIKMVVAGCSTGEEAFSYSMILNSLKDKLSILGFDLSQKSIDTAKSGKLSIQIIKNKLNPIIEKCLFQFTSFQNDIFLISNSTKKLSQEKLDFKKLFDECFELTGETKQLPLLSRLKVWYLNKIARFNLPEYKYKIIKLKDNKCSNCNFKTGDIMKLKETLCGEKADVLTFSNAMYHLITKEISDGLRIPIENPEKIVRKIAQNVKESLNPNGIFVLGEREAEQTLDEKTVAKVFTEMGFKPLNETAEHQANIWQLLN